MANNFISGNNPEFELIAPVKILVRPSFDGTETTPSSVRRRSISLNDVSARSQRRVGGESSGVFLVSDQLEETGRGKESHEVAIQVEDDERITKNVAYYLEHSLQLMYIAGMSTFNPRKKDDGNKCTWMEIILNLFQKVRIINNSYVTKIKSCHLQENF